MIQDFQHEVRRIAINDGSRSLPTVSATNVRMIRTGGDGPSQYDCHCA